jgi:hypothetical protein
VLVSPQAPEAAEAKPTRRYDYWHTTTCVLKYQRSP